MVEDAKVGNIGDSGDCKNETVKRLLLKSKNLNGTTGYLTPNTKQAFI